MRGNPQLDFLLNIAFMIAQWLWEHPTAVVTLLGLVFLGGIASALAGIDAGLSEIVDELHAIKDVLEELKERLPEQPKEEFI